MKKGYTIVLTLKPAQYSPRVPRYTPKTGKKGLCGDQNISDFDFGKKKKSDYKLFRAYYRGISIFMNFGSFYR